MNITEVREVVEHYNSLLHSLLGGIKNALETHPNDPNQVAIQKDFQGAIATTQKAIAGLDDKIVHLSDEVVNLAIKVNPLVELGEELAENLKGQSSGATPPTPLDSSGDIRHPEDICQEEEATKG